MIVLWVTLLLLHQGHTLTPVTTVQLGEPATLTCVSPDEKLSARKVHWYKQSARETLKLVVSMWNLKPQYAPEFPASRFVLNHDKKSSNLTILKTTEEDEGMYQWCKKTRKTSNYTVVQPPASDPVRAGAPMTLQCSVLSDSETKTCPGDHSVFWFRAGAKESHPNIIYTDGRTSNEYKGSEVIFLLCVIQALSLTVIICLIYALKNKESGFYNAAVAVQKHRSGQQRDEDAQFYSAVVFTMMKTGCDAMKEKNAAERQRIYAAVKAFGLD
ncbi:uncharacterized protein LOC131981380 [Centropristis striata]|uniref:uncharacterized protein LOC131981380 n=1 Tax=Centropristis striata TaxID=184440 RepID=UPI0027DECD7D|nr:uncharacterized protein LOC131981380 [Centropristis striata]